MQTTVTLSGTPFIRIGTKLLVIFFATAFACLLWWQGSRPAEEKIIRSNPASKRLGALVDKMCAATARDKKNKPGPAAGMPVDIDLLKQSNWYDVVRHDIRQRMYNIAQGSAAGDFESMNEAQGLKAVYHPAGFSLQPIKDAGQKAATRSDWELDIAVKGLFADNAPVQSFDGNNALMTTSSEDVSYDYGHSVSIQYHNDSKGIRQNFVVRQNPGSGIRELKVALQAQGEWVVNRVHSRELHFAKIKGRDQLENMVTYNDLKAWDANGMRLAARMEVGEDNNFAIIADVSHAIYPVTIDPLSTSPSTTLTEAGTFGNSVASAGDVNGDGYSDVIVGDASAAMAFIYLGSASGLSASPADTLTGTGYFGVSVAGAGDVNGDGFSDVIVGDASGHAYIYTGSSSGLSSSPATTLAGSLTFGVSVSGAGDVNGDGYSDVIVGNGLGGAYVYTGSSSGVSTIGSALTGGSGVHYGLSVATAGDVNGDGYSDVVVGNAGGSAFLYEGSAGGISTTVTLTLTGTGLHYGASVATATDINGDGYSDVIVGDAGGDAYIYLGSHTGLSSMASDTLTGAGAFGTTVSGAGDVNGDAFGDVIIGDSSGNAYVFIGSISGIASGTSATATTHLTGSGDFGISVTSAGDVNGDGYSDVIVGAPDGSEALIYQGSPGGSVSTSTNTIYGAAGDRYGLSVSTAGDINGDGYNDVIVGVIGYNGITGAAYIYLGSASGIPTTSPIILTVPFTGNQENFGWSVAGAGDINGDGYDDIVVGARYETVSSNGGVFIYLGNSSGTPTLETTIIGPNSYDFFGNSVSSAGDINGDGYGDIIVGAPGVSITGSSAGAAFIYLGSPSGITSSTVADTLYGSGNYVGFGTSVSYAGDVNGDGYADVIVGTEGGGGDSAFVYIGSKNGIQNDASPTYRLGGQYGNGTAGDFGTSVSSAGDVNGDGYSDVIVGASQVSAGTSGGPGTAAIFLGSASGLSNVAATVLTGINPGDQFGASVSSAGDVNGDGYSDVIVRATLATSNLGVQTGAAYVFLGGPTGVASVTASSAAAIFVDEGGEYNSTIDEGTNYRKAVASAGDVNGDGYSDVMVGAYLDSTKGIKAGAMHLYYGNQGIGHNGSNVLQLYELDLTDPIAADNLTKSDFGLGLYVQSPFGAVKGKMVWETEPNGTPFQGYPTSITNSVVYTQGQTADTLIAAGGREFKSLIPKSPGKATKVRVRIQYAPTAVTLGQTYGPWIYSQVYLLGGDLGVLPLSLQLTANPSGQNIIVNWKVSEENNMSAYVVQHSLDGVNFDSVGQVAANNDAGKSTYSFTHYHPGQGLHFYRLKEVSEASQVNYSQIVSARLSDANVTFNVYPNPATDHIVVTYSGTTSDYIRIINAAGSVVGQYQLDASAGQITLSLLGFARGNYFVELVNSGFAPRQIAVQ